jgi:two-component system, NarL family, sensor histidine kinase DesK
MDTDVAPASPAEAQWVAAQRRWAHGWRLHVLRAIPLAYLLYVVGAVRTYSHGAAAIAGYAILAAFAAVWLLGPLLLSAPGTQFTPGRPAASRWFWIFYAVLVALLVAELPFGRAPAFVIALFITMATVVRLGSRATPIVAVLALAALLAPVAVPSWHESIGASFGTVTPIAIPIVALVTFFVLQVLEGNRALTEARAELARLAAENERYRIARDLHDLLGHSLTTITVKAGLARRLDAADHDRALQEMAEVEALARRSLADVRAAVANYRDVTLSGELATGRELLRAAGIAADLPRAVDVVDPAHQELFGWAVREGLTNIVRHAHASSCTVLLSPSSVEIVDDGVGLAAPPGNGLSGLRERVAAAGGVVDAGPLQPRGWRLRVSLSPAGSA